MSQASEYAMVFCASLLFALLGTPLIRAAAFRLGAIDHPDQRRVHLRPTPLLGGLAIFGAAIAAIALTHSFQGPALGGLIGAAIILLVGFLDDLYHLSPKVKLSGQIAAALVLLPFGISVETTGVQWVDAFITIFWVVGIANAFNLIDNMDGLSAGIAAIAAFSFFAIASHAGQYVVAATSLGLCGACLGFLWYNFGRRPARIFMGDTGSLFVGYLLAVLAVRLTYASLPWVTPIVPIAILGVPILDTTFVVITRLRQRRPIYQGGKDHISHRLVERIGLASRAAVGLLWLISALLGAGAVFAVTRISWVILPSVALLGLLGALVGLIGIIRLHGFSPKPMARKAEKQAFPRPKRVLVVLPTYNERENILPLMDELLGLEAPVDLLVVDDNSPDGTADAVRQAAERNERIHLLRRSGKLGLGTAYTAGFAHGLECGYDCVITMDADFSHRPKYLPSLLEGASQCDLVIGSRYIKGGGIENWPWHRRMLSRGANLLTRTLLSLPAHDCTSGYRCYGRGLLETISWKEIRANGYAFLEEMLYRAHSAGFSIGERPIIFADRRAGDSKISKTEILRGMLTLFRLSLERLAGRQPKAGKPPEGGRPPESTDK